MSGLGTMSARTKCRSLLVLTVLLVSRILYLEFRFHVQRVEMRSLAHDRHSKDAAVSRHRFHHDRQGVEYGRDGHDFRPFRPELGPLPDNYIGWRAATFYTRMMSTLRAVVFGGPAPKGVIITVDLSAPARPVPKTLFGIFFEEINHAGAGGLYAELVQNRGFEAGGPAVPSTIAPWAPVGSESQVWLETERSSLFAENPIALRMEIRCNATAAGGCPPVGISNPGYWGMNIKKGHTYELVLWLRSESANHLNVSLTSASAMETLASETISWRKGELSKWQKRELRLEATGADPAAHLTITSTTPGTIWMDQVSVMPTDTYKGHGMRKELAEMLEAMRPGFIRFPGGCYVEGDRLADAFHWRQTVGPWERRPGHYNGPWAYWSDDGLGFYEYLQLCEDIGSIPVWVFNNGLSHTDEVYYPTLGPFIKDVLDGIEFARGSAASKWGRVRADMGHPEPFDLRYVAVGNEDCAKANYRGSFLRFHAAIKAAYPDIKLISNCDATAGALDHPADLFDYHIYTTAADLFSKRTFFDSVPRTGGPKVFASEYALNGAEAGNGNLLAAVVEASFMLGLERNSDVVEMASYAPLFVNANDRTWNPDAIVFDSQRQYGTPSYWAQRMLAPTTNGGAVLDFSIAMSYEATWVLAASVNRLRCPERGQDFLIIKLVNVGALRLDLDLRLAPDGSGRWQLLAPSNATITVLTGAAPTDENSFSEPQKVAPRTSALDFEAPRDTVALAPLSLTILEFPLTEAAPTS